MTTYFGECNSDGSLTGVPAGYDYGGAAYISNVAIDYTCPGSGTQNIYSLGVYARSGGTSGDIRCAIYNTSWGLICQWDAALNIADDTPSWREKLAANMTGTLTLTGGVVYRLIYGIAAGTNPRIGYNTGSGWKYEYADYTTGFPSTVSAPTGTSAGNSIMRIGVSDAATIEQEGFRAGKDDGSEAAHSFLTEAQDTDFKAPIDTNLMIRWLVNTSGDVATTPFQLEGRKSGDTVWNKI